MAKKRKEVLKGKTLKVKTECGAVYLTLNKQDKNLFEVRMELGKTGNCQRGLLHLIGVHLSDKLQTVETSKEFEKFILRHYQKFSCGCPFHYKGKPYKSCMDWAGEKIIEELTDGG
tara:strand:+ start:1095 stop:1442 length:348 start_codon:yes stop_codon:yes gene_type:complete